MSHTEATSCTLPLLDGEDISSPHLISAEIELEVGEKFRSFDKGNGSPFNDILCTAWGLLLRCYTGQDDVSFHVRNGNIGKLISSPATPSDHLPTFRMAFADEDTLLKCIRKAQDWYANDVRGRQPLASARSESSLSQYQNSFVWVQDASCKDTQDTLIQKVDDRSFLIPIKSEPNIYYRETFGYLRLAQKAS